MGWNDVKSNGNCEQKEVKYYSTKEGRNQIRVLDDEPFSRWTHWLPKANGGKGLGINCPGKGCPVCAIMKEDKANKKPPRFTSRKMHDINVLNRDTGEVNVLSKGNGVFEQLLGLYEEMGDLKQYDIVLRVSGSGKDTSYTAIPMAKTPLTDTEKALEKYDFKDMYTDLTLDQIEQLMSGASFKDIFAEETTNDTASDDTSADEEVQVSFNK